MGRRMAAKRTQNVEERIAEKRALVARPSSDATSSTGGNSRDGWSATQRLTALR